MQVVGALGQVDPSDLHVRGVSAPHRGEDHPVRLILGFDVHQRLDLNVNGRIPALGLVAAAVAAVVAVGTIVNGGSTLVHIAKDTGSMLTKRFSGLYGKVSNILTTYNC